MIDTLTLLELLRYDPETGELFWRPRRPCHFAETSRSASGSCAQWNARHADKPALTANNGHGYRRGPIFGKYYLAHRVCWALHFGEWPSFMLDHIDNNRQNNRISNLRPATLRENCRNSSASKRGTSKYLGVSWNRSKKRWDSTITVDRECIRLGRYQTEIEAAEAYDRAARKYFGDFANPNFS